MGSLPSLHIQSCINCFNLTMLSSWIVLKTSYHTKEYALLAECRLLLAGKFVCDLDWCSQATVLYKQSLLLGCFLLPKTKASEGVRNVKTAGSKLPLPFVGTISHGEPGVCLREPRWDSMSQCSWMLQEDAKHFKMLHHVFIRSHNQHSSTFWTLALLILSVFVYTGHSLIQRQLRKRCFNIASLGKHEDPKKPSVWDVCRDPKLTKTESKALAHF